MAKKTTTISIEEDLMAEVVRRHYKLSPLISELLRSHLGIEKTLEVREGGKDEKKTTVVVEKGVAELMRVMKGDMSYSAFLLKTLLPIYFKKQGYLKSEDENFYYFDLKAKDIIDQIGTVEYAEDGDMLVFPK